ncbi:MAG: hypothetical protein ABI193_01060, partial [Minicystis sp.]
ASLATPPPSPGGRSASGQAPAPILAALVGILVTPSLILPNRRRRLPSGKLPPQPSAAVLPSAPC